jgi:hypothetical protein
MAVVPPGVGEGVLQGVGSTPRLFLILLLSTMNGSTNSYCISTSPRIGQAVSNLEGLP